MLPPDLLVHSRHGRVVCRPPRRSPALLAIHPLDWHFRARFHQIADAAVPRDRPGEHCTNALSDRGAVFSTRYETCLTLLLHVTLTLISCRMVIARFPLPRTVGASQHMRAGSQLLGPARVVRAFQRHERVLWSHPQWNKYLRLNVRTVAADGASALLLVEVLNPAKRNKMK